MCIHMWINILMYMNIYTVIYLGENCRVYLFFITFINLCIYFNFILYPNHTVFPPNSPPTPPFAKHTPIHSSQWVRSPMRIHQSLVH